MARPVRVHDQVMALHWTLRITSRARELGTALRRDRRQTWQQDGVDARRVRADLDAIRARFQDHA
jgi:hypothetical protein